jgi:AbrB family looped-hinge helix DNA binding protein
MKTSIDSAGRVVVPKEIRDRLGLTGGQELEIVERDGLIELRPPVTKVTLEETDTGLTAIPEVSLPPLTADVVREVLERGRR